MKFALIAVAALAVFAAAEPALAQTGGGRDSDEQLVVRAESDRRALVLAALQLTDAEVAAFTPVYDKYQQDLRQQFENAATLLNKYAANYGSMTDDAAKDILKEWFGLREERSDLMRKYAKEMGRVMPPAKVLQWVQVENRLNTLLDARAVGVVPVSR